MRKGHSRERCSSAAAVSNWRILGLEYFVKKFAEKMAKRIHGAAAKLGIPPSTLESKIKQLKIRKQTF
jgi:hypothetical protein